ncbi:cyclin-like protein [Obelidium mucronatum]|nr:cyclin-like protein [Obelidium mucronatum]
MANPPSIAHMSLAQERECRAKACKYISNVGIALKLPANVIATALIFMHRFYMRQSFHQHRYHDVSGAAIFLATKVEEAGRRLKSVIQALALKANKGADPSFKIDESSKQFRNWWDTIMYYEEMMLAVLCWDLTVDYPYEWILRLCKLNSSPQIVKETAWALVNDSYRHPLCLCYKSVEIAAACMIVAQIITRAQAVGVAGVPGFEGDGGNEKSGGQHEHQNQDIPVDYESMNTIVTQAGTVDHRAADIIEVLLREIEKEYLKKDI